MYNSKKKKTFFFYNSLIKKNVLSIFFFYILFLFKGWKHLLGLPVKNQRTRSNHISSFKNNLILRNFQYFSLKKKNKNVSKISFFLFLYSCIKQFWKNNY